MAVMNDFRYSKEWGYAFRWVPARLFLNQIKVGSPELIGHFLGHTTLSPEKSLANRYILPHEYIRRKKAIEDKWLRENQDIVERAKELSGQFARIPKKTHISQIKKGQRQHKIWDSSQDFDCGSKRRKLPNSEFKQELAKKLDLKEIMS